LIPRKTATSADRTIFSSTAGLAQALRFTSIERRQAIAIHVPFANNASEERNVVCRYPSTKALGRNSWHFEIRMPFNVRSGHELK
jgi:hypothetical protein